MGEIRLDVPTSCQKPDVASDNAVIFRFGDTLQNIANCQGVELKDLMAANNITDPNAVLPGREIKIPRESYAASVPASSSAPQKPASAPNAGSVDAKSAAEIKLRQATVEGLVHKATSVGVGPSEIAIIASLAMRALSAAQFNHATSAVQQALTSASPKVAMAKLGPTIIQGSSDPITTKAASRLARSTGFTTTSLDPGTLAGVDDVTIVAHANEVEVAIRGERLSPAQLAERLREAGFEGGTVRLVACKTGAEGATFATELAKELRVRGMGSVIIAPDAKVMVASKTELPQVRYAAGNFRPPGEGWKIIMDETPEALGEGGALAASGDGIGALSGMRAGAGELLGFIGFMTAPLELLSNYLNSYEDAKNNIKADNYTKGFAQGMAAAIVGDAPGDVRSKFGLETADPSITDRVLGAEGLAEKFHNKGLVDGYKLFRSLPPKQQKALRQGLAVQGLDVKNKSVDNILHVEVSILPNVKEMFKRAREEEEAIEDESGYQ